LSIQGSIKGRIIRACGANTVGHFLHIGVRLLLVPLFVCAWGTEAYGEWLILTALAAWFHFGDFGGQTYYVNKLTADYAAAKYDSFQKLYSTGMLFFLCSSFVIVVCILCVLVLSPIVNWLNLSYVSRPVVIAVLGLIAVRFFIALPAGLLLGVYRAIGKQATGIMYANLIVLIHFIASAAVLLAGGGMLWLAALEVVPFLIVGVIVFIDLRKRLSERLSITALGRADRNIFLKSIKPSLHFLSLQFSQALMIQGSVLVLAKALGPVEVAIFSTMRVIANVMQRVIGTLVNSVWPEIIRLAAIKNAAVLLRLFKVIIGISLGVGICYLFIVVNWGEFLYNVWLSKKLPYDNVVMYILSFQVVFNVFWTWGAHILKATNRHEEYARAQIPCYLFALAVCYMGAEHYGLRGGVIGLFVGQSLPMLFIVSWFLIKKGWSNMARSLMVASGLGVVLMSMTINIFTGILAVGLSGLYLVMDNRHLFKKRFYFGKVYAE
jgi:O-antigen/teichoic acid export membrane protein